MTAVIVLPSIHPPYTEACLDGLAPDVAALTVVVDNTVENRGVAGSWNIGARRVLDEGLDWLVSLSAATRFGPCGGRDFIDLLDRYSSSWVVESSVPVGWHLIGWSRELLERVGLFDENHWPAYGEDADMAHRVGVAISESDWPAYREAWRVEPVDAWLAMQGHGTKLAGVQVDMTKTWAYHRAKWGGLSGHETCRRPFGDPTLPLGFWPTPPDPRSIIGVRP